MFVVNRCETEGASRVLDTYGPYDYYMAVWNAEAIIMDEKLNEHYTAEEIRDMLTRDQFYKNICINRVIQRD